MKFDLQMSDGNKVSIEIPKFLPYTTGRKIRSAVQSVMTVDGKEQKNTINNPTSVLGDIQDILLEDLIPEQYRKAVDLSTLDRLYIEYEPQIQGEIKKKSHKSTTCSNRGGR